jgi:hypothetical protein
VKAENSSIVSFVLSSSLSLDINAEDRSGKTAVHYAG